MKRELRADRSDSGFAIGIYLEHLAEASALWEQRRQLLDDPEIAWPDLVDFESRIEAHIDALVLGGELAIDVCAQQSTVGDAGEFFAAVCVICRHRRLDLLRTFLESMDPADDDRVVAAAEALAIEAPPEWDDLFRRMVTVEHPALNRIAARVIGYRRIPASNELIAALGPAGDQALPQIIAACGRLGVVASAPALWNLVDRHDDDAIASESAFALLRLGDARVIDVCLRHPAGRPALLAAVGVGGGWKELRALIDLRANGLGGGAACIALGMLGEISAIEALIAALEGPDAADAALGLHLITGAPLYGDMSPPEPPDEPIDDDEDDATGQPPANGEPSPTPQMTDVLTADPVTWRTWWTASSSHFQPFARYRLGALRSPQSLVASLRAERLPRRVRELILHELALHFGQNAWFEADAPVAQQMRVLADLDSWAMGAVTTFQPGGWPGGVE